MAAKPTPSTASRVAEKAARSAYGKLVAILTQRTGNLADAEDALADAFSRALQTWPEAGTPSNPEAWLLTTARNRLTDMARKGGVRDKAHADLLVLAEDETAPSAPSQTWPDERLGLMLACAHPDIDAELHAPLMLQAVLGLDAARIASAFLIKPATMGQRLSRGKARIREARLAFDIPDPDALPARLEPVLNAIYAAYGTGWDALGAQDGPVGLASDALTLARLVAERVPASGQALGLLALTAHCQARVPARRSAQGAFVALADQDTTLWDTALIEEGEAALRRALEAGPPGRFALEAAIQSVHAERRLTGHTNWPAAAALYDGLLNTGQAGLGAAVARASAHGEAYGAKAALAALDEIAEPSESYQPWHAVRAHWLAQDGQLDAARAAYETAAALASDPGIRAWLKARRAAV